MRRAFGLLAALACCALPFASAADAPNVLVDTQPGAPTAAIEVWFRAPSDGYDGSKPGIARIALAAAAASPLESGRSLSDFARSVGGRLTISVYPDISSVSLLVPASSARRAVATMTAAYFMPKFAADALHAAMRDATVFGVEARFDPDGLLKDGVFAALFDRGPAHMPATPTDVRALTTYTLDAVQAYAERAFRASNAFVTAAGAVSAADVAAMNASHATAFTPDPPIDSPLSASPQNVTITGEGHGIAYGWIGPPIAHERDATALDFIADYLFRNQTGAVTRAFARSNAGVLIDGQFITLHDPGIFVLAISGDGSDAVHERVLAALTAMAQPLDAATFAAARNAFVYHLLSESDTPNARADNLGWYSAEGNPAYAPAGATSRYVQIAQALDPQFVASVAKKYLMKGVTVRLVSNAQQTQGA